MKISTKNVTHNEFPLSDRRGHRVCKQALGKQMPWLAVPTAGMDGNNSGSVDKRSLTPFISFLMGKAKSSLTASESDKQISSTPLTITRSLLTVFLARKSLKKDWIAGKELSRWIRASQDLLHRLCKFSSDDAIRYSKYWLDHLLVLLTKDINDEPLPQEKFSKPLFSGVFKRMIDRSLLKEDGRFILSLQRGAKLVWPALSESAKVDSYSDHKKNICGRSRILGLNIQRNTDFDSPDYFSEDYFKVDLVDTLKNVSHELFGSITDEDYSKLTPPSKACYERSRRSGGPQFMHSRIGGLPQQSNIPVPGPCCFAPAPPPTVPGGLGLLPLISQKINSHRQSVHEQAIEGLLKTPGDKLGDIAVMAVTEAAKFRILNKMRGHLVVALQPLQGAMLSKWKDHPTSTMRHQDLTSKVSDLVRGIPDRLKMRFNKFASIDYKGATDTLPRRASYVALSGLPDGSWKELAKASFIRGSASYPRVTSECDGKKTVLQERSLLFQNEGQLMGHLLSFPLLCAINLACYRLAVHRWAEQGDVEERTHRAQEKFSLLNNVIVNGDDMQFRADDEFYQIFDGCRREAGFVYSAGKNYFSVKWALINSQLFKINENQTKSCVRRYHYLNQRLLEGSSLKNGDSQATPMDIARDLNEMVENVPWTRCVIPTVFKRWPQFNKYNWYIPVALGGMGVNVKFAPDDLKFTRFQRMLAAHLVNNPDVALLKQLGKAILPCIVTNTVDWVAPFDGEPGGLVGEILRPSKDERNSLKKLLKIAVPTVTLVEDGDGVVPDLPWLERLAYFSELNGYSGMRNAEIFESGWMAANFPEKFSHKPLSDREFQKYWNCGWRCESSAVPVPPLYPIQGRFHVETRAGPDDVVQEYTILPGSAVKWGLDK